MNDGRSIDIERLGERLAELERLVEGLDGVPDPEAVEVLGRAVALLEEVNAGIEDGLAAAEGEARRLDELLERVDFGSFDAAVEDLEGPGGG